MGVPGRRDFSFHAFSEGTRRVLFHESRAGPLYRGWGSRNSRCSIVEGRPFRNKAPLIFHLPDLTAPLDSSTRARDSHVCPLTWPCLALTPTGVLRTLCSNRRALSMRSPIVYGILMIPNRNSKYTWIPGYTFFYELFKTCDLERVSRQVLITILHVDKNIYIYRNFHEWFDYL